MSSIVPKSNPSLCALGSPYSPRINDPVGRIRSDVAAFMISFCFNNCTFLEIDFFYLNRFKIFGRFKIEFRRVAWYRLQLFYAAHFAKYYHSCTFVWSS